MYLICLGRGDSINSECIVLLNYNKIFKLFIIKHFMLYNWKINKQKTGLNPGIKFSSKLHINDMQNL